MSVHWHENEGAASRAYKETTTLYVAVESKQYKKLDQTQGVFDKIGPIKAHSISLTSKYSNNVSHRS